MYMIHQCYISYVYIGDKTLEMFGNHTFIIISIVYTIYIALLF